MNFFSNLISFPVPMRLEQHLASRRKKLRNKLMQILCKVANHIDIECPPLPRDWQCRFRILCAWAYHRNQRRTPSPPWWTWQRASSIWDCLLRFFSISLADEVLEHWVLRMCQDLGSASLGCSRKPGKFDSCHSSMVWMRTVNYNYAGRCQLHTGASFPATVSGKISGSEDKATHTHAQIHTLRKFGLRILT